MKTRFTAGFTIIETMLVLAITGALVAGIFIGVGNSIGVQRYRDAAETAKNRLQHQYAELSNVKNDRQNTWSCGPTAATTEEAPQVRGQSDCVMVGRLLVMQGESIRTYSVLAYKGGSSTPNPDNDIARLRANYTLNVSSVETDQSTQEWGTSIGWPRSGAGAGGSSPRSLSILFIKSPDSGQLYTFSSDAAPETPSNATLRDMIVAGNTTPGQGERVICINSDSFVTGDRLAIVMAQYAASSSAIELMTNTLLEQSGRTSRC